jgi:hypothetical protein
MHRIDSDAAFTYPAYEAEEVADFLAGGALRSILVRPSELERIRVQAAKFPDDPPVEDG